MDYNRSIKRDSLKNSIFVELRDATSKDPKTAIVATGTTLSYVRSQSASVAVTAVDLAAATSAHAAGGIKEVDATNMPGVYRLDLPDAAVAKGVRCDEVVVSLKNAGIVTCNVLIKLHDLIDYDSQTSDTVKVTN